MSINWHRTGNQAPGKSAKNLGKDSVMHTIVELIGPSGIGKSTLLKALSQSTQSPPWLDLVAAGREELAKPRTSATPWAPADLFLLDRKLTNTLAEQFNVLHRYQHLHNRYNRLHYDVLLRENPRNGVFVDDDHVCHLFTTELVALGQVEPDLFRTFMAGRAFIFLKLPASQILRNIRARERSGIGRAGVTGVSDAAILARTQQRLEDSVMLSALVGELGLPQILVDLEEPQADNLQKMIGFLKTLTPRPPAQVSG